MFDSNYLVWNQHRIKAIIDFFGHKTFYKKTILDLGCGHADIGGALYRLGGEITAVDARQEHLNVAIKKFPGIKTMKVDLDQGWPFKPNQFDYILDLAILCHLRDYEQHLINICSSGIDLIIETAVFDTNHDNRCHVSSENKGIYDNSINGVQSLPSAAAIERVLRNCGMTFTRMDSPKLNSGNYIYDWVPANNGDLFTNKRRLWFAHKTNNPSIAMSVSSPAHVLTVPNPIAENNPTVIKNTYRNAHNQKIEEATIPLITPELPKITKSFGKYMADQSGRRFVIVIPSYKNSKWCVQNITSALNQDYGSFRIIFTDDCSPDDTFDKVAETVKNSGKTGLVTLIKNTERLGALHNLYNMIHSCDDDEIVLTLDGDDWFPDDVVLTKLSQAYTEDVWLTYGQYRASTDGSIGIAQPYPDNIIASNNFRRHVWSASHLRTFYAWLFKKIRKEDLMQDGKFFSMTWDFAIMFPMLEMAGIHSKFLSDILYIYNMDNPINDHKVDVGLQQRLDAQIRHMSRYSLTDPPPRKLRVGLILIATAKYNKFVQDIIASADKNFLTNQIVRYYLLTDAPDQEIASSRQIIRIPIEHKPFPFASMDRFSHFIHNFDQLSNEEFLYYVDVDCKFVDTVSTEIIGDLVGVEHCGYYKHPETGTYETNPKSVFYVENASQKYKHYFGGGFSGGRSGEYLDLSRWCMDMINQDVANGIMPLWNDETALNRYFLDHEPSVILSPSYHYPESNLEHYKAKWGYENIHPRILLLDKNHQEIRS
jgi:glycosyltransferase involved in cell wall biosynthesis/SAM-dependent methyltransferase